jgi:hypothetical protein
MIVQTGDVIRSYDFKPMLGRDDCFVEGMVIEATAEQGYDAYKIRVTKDSWVEGDADTGRFGKVIFVPVAVAYNDYPGRVMNLSRV